MGGTVTAVGAAAAAVVVMTVLGAVGGITVPMVVTVVVLVVVKVRLVGSIFSNLGQPAGLGEVQRKTAPDTEAETHLTVLVEWPQGPGARAEVDPHSTHCECPLPMEGVMQRLWGQVCSADPRAS